MRFVFVCFVLSIQPLAYAESLLPNSWSGTWTGDLLTNSGRRIGMSILIERQSENSMSWKMQYQGQVVRAYQLRLNSKAQLILDEGNNIELLTTFVAPLNALTSHFQVDNQLLTTTYVLESPTQMRFELTSSSFSPINDVRVQSFPISAYQRAILTKN